MVQSENIELGSVTKGAPPPYRTIEGTAQSENVELGSVTKRWGPKRTHLAAL